jgi:hypothetical protein
MNPKSYISWKTCSGLHVLITAVRFVGGISPFSTEFPENYPDSNEFL